VVNEWTLAYALSAHSNEPNQYTGFLAMYENVDLSTAPSVTAELLYEKHCAKGNAANERTIYAVFEKTRLFWTEDKILCQNTISAKEHCCGKLK